MTMVVNNFGAANRWLQQAGEEALNQLGHFLVGEAKRRTPVDTGILRGANQFRIVSVSDGKMLQLFNNTEYAGFVHEGTRYMKPRRFITDAVNQNQTKIKEVAAAAYRKGF
jgi:HK97 gp10 family phage protein